jgi:DNA mismatch repair protein MutL
MDIQSEIARVLALPNDVIDQIAAGEVVERPSHLVKELVENSLDAGATSVTVDVFAGGRAISVKDNGYGIHRDDLALILKRHTTSKITSADDLWKLSSFGFRGEALSSISAVSKMRVLSRRRGMEEAFQIEAQFGREMPLDTISHDHGTTVEVRDLFENLPARLKFLKSASAEVSAIRQMVKSMALVNPGNEFRLRVEGELDFYVPEAENFFERVKMVLGEDRLCFTTAERDGMKLELVFSDPHLVQKTSRSLWFFVQGRPVQDKSLQTAIIEAYRGTLMHGEYPMAVLKLHVPADEVDVNIHPTKSQVKFLKPNLIFSFVHHTLRRGLEDHLKPRNQLKADEAPAPQIFQFESAELNRVQYQTKDLHSPLTVAEPSRQSSKPALPNFAVSGRIQTAAEFGQESHRNGDTFVQVTAAATPAPVKASTSNAGTWSRLQVLAQSHLTYLICQSNEGLCLVDQHAAHERVLFETLNQAWSQGRGVSQSLLFPLAVDLSPEQIEALDLVKQGFQKLGLVWEGLGPGTLGIVQLPELVKETALPGLLRKIADDVLRQGGSFEFEKAVHEILSTMACHSAIRAGQALSLQEMEALLKQMDEFPFSQFCPHGRPVSVRWSIDELEREFGRRK